MNPQMVLYLNFNQDYSYHGDVQSSLTWHTKHILWIDGHVLIMTYKSLAMGDNMLYLHHKTWFFIHIKA